jgi:hypothetical protein
MDSMLKWFAKKARAAVELCERCGQICTAACRREAERRRVRDSLGSVRVL